MSQIQDNLPLSHETKTYGMPGYPYGQYPQTSLDTWPSLLIAAHNYYQASKDERWVKAHIDKLLDAIFKKIQDVGFNIPLLLCCTAECH